MRFVTGQQDEQLKKLDDLLQALGYDVAKEEKKVFVDVVIETLDCIGQGMSKEEVYNLVHNKNAYIYVDEATLKNVDEKMPPEEELQDLADFFKVFGDATRLKILYVLLCSEMCVYDISTILGMSQSAISHQRRVLKQMDLVKNRREGKTIFYSLADDHITTILSQGLDHIEE